MRKRYLQFNEITSQLMGRPKTVRKYHAQQLLGAFGPNFGSGQQPRGAKFCRSNSNLHMQLSSQESPWASSPDLTMILFGTIERNRRKESRTRKRIVLH